jgi:NodT family efflux transporter outer membrane factor (OMF) lipoprotein
MHHPKRPRLKALIAPLTVVALLALAACSTQQDVQPTLRATDEAKLGLSRPATQEVSEQLAPWWEAFGDAQLSALIQQALSDNPSMQVAQTRWRRAQAAETFTRGSDLPQVQATAKTDRQHFTEHGVYPPPLAGSTRTIGTLQLEGSWELDLFGKQRAELDAAIGQNRAAQADVQAARLLLSSQVARSYAQLGRLQAQRLVAERNLAQRNEMLSLIRQRVQAGLDTTVELKQGEGALPDVRNQIEALDEQIGLARHALAALTGQPPAALDGLSVSISALKVPALPSRVPMDLLARRADVMAALWRAQAAGHQVDAARAMFYPNIDLVSYAGYNSIGLDQLLKPGSWQWGLMPAIHLPLFDGDRRRANLQGKVAEQDAALAGYNQVVLQAVQEVADQLHSAQSITRQQREQADAQASVEASYQLAKQRYGAGLGTYLTVLSAESAVLQQRRLAVDLQARAADTQLALVRALGGSLSPAPVASAPPTSAQATQAAQATSTPNNTPAQTGDRS